MQSSKLPRYNQSASKLPQSLQLRDIRPLETRSENAVPITRAHEAPPSTSQRAMFRAALRRRSRSVADFKVRTEQAPLKSFSIARQPLKLRALKTTTTNSDATGVAKPGTSNPTKPIAGAKRPLLVNKSEEGAPKAKVFKKIPDWDYKARFNQLNEKYQISQNTIKSMKQDTVDMSAQVTKLEAENEDLKKRNQSLTNEKQNILRLQEQLQAENDKLTVELKEHTEQMQSVKDDLAQYVSKAKSLEDHVTTLKKQLMVLESQRRIMHNTIQDLKGNIRVFCRVRPRLAHETDNLECPITFPEENSLVLRKRSENVSQITGKSQDSSAEFTFDKVFSQTSTQKQIFEDLEQLIQSALDGYNVCVFAYGQTGSGKTYTMQGGEGDDQGVLPRTTRLIFQKIEELETNGWQYSVEASFVEIYNENVRDLLNLTSNQKLDICFNEGRGTTVNNLTKQPVDTVAKLEFYMRKAHHSRATAATNFNEHSSRSHAITKIFLKGVNPEENVSYEGSINLVDLAGSESAKFSIAGERLNETKNINKSLAVLGDVICALFNKSPHVPYRNSKLTYLLQSSLSGNSKTLMIVTISPLEECFGESLSSLRFAAKVKKVKTNSKKNKVVPPNTPV